MRDKILFKRTIPSNKSNDMATPQNTIAIVYDYDQTLSPSYMQDEVVFPAFGINKDNFWRRCSELVRDDGYDNELAYMKVLLDHARDGSPDQCRAQVVRREAEFLQRSAGDV